ncbi:MAG: YqjK-like family protein [Rhodocyclaceae bacterium]|nr:YqjK-like family protein [Rhodocyclaceae bacterium]
MNALELALAKQRLQLKAAAERAALGEYAAGLAPLFAAGDHIVAGARWLKHHPEAVVGGVAALVALRPGALRFLWRWGRRSLLAWQFWRDAGRWLSAR